jgi:hypothetical protein
VLASGSFHNLLRVYRHSQNGDSTQCQGRNKYTQSPSPLDKHQR